jgi:proteasome lid subunit RPN8/RPN11
MQLLVMGYDVMGARLILKQSVVDSVLTYAQMAYPKEGILLLRGHVTPQDTVISDVVIPPRAVHGFGFANFPWHMLPMDRSILGTAHSHPSGSLRPSIQDLNHYYGRIMIITVYPFHSHQDLGAFDRNGAIVNYDVEDDDDELAS